MADLYTNAAKIIEKILAKQGGPKSLVINNRNIGNKKKLYALVCEALKYQQIPRYVRVNTLKMSTEEAICWFKNDGYELKPAKSKSFTVDEHVPDVLVFPAGTDFHGNQLYCDGKIILQDKASCFPAFVLDPPPGSCVIDACSAPGNKTSHLAAIMQNNGRIIAFDISPKRIATMKKLLQKTGEHVTEVKNEDFLKTNPEDAIYKDVAYILVDPSCSGSGIVTRLDYVDKTDEEMDDKEKQRITSLANFQKTVLSHALSFPAVEKVVYSTCSIHNEENEQVVGEVLEQYKETFELSNVLPSWPHRGHPIIREDDSVKCVRASPQEGATSGFFLALFTRKPPLLHQEDGGETETNENTTITKKKKRKRKSGEYLPDVQNDSVKKIKTLTQDNRKPKNRKKEKRKKYKVE